MKRLMIWALVFVASASLFPAEAAKKKDKKQPDAPVVEPVQLVTSSDSVSYVCGKYLTKGLVPYLTGQKGVDTTYMADFVKGFQEVQRMGTDPKMKAYVVGMEIATMVRDRMLPDMVKDFTDSPDSIISGLLYRGFIDALLNDTTYFTQADAEAFFSKKDRADKAAKEEKLHGPNRRAGEAFLAENAKKEGVVTLRSGLQYKVLVEGHGDVPKKTDKVQVNYEGRLIDGTVFDASNKHGDKPVELRVDQVISGWTEALSMMPVGSKWQIYLPYNLAYGNRETGDIKPYSALVFDVELVGISKVEKAKVEK